MKLYLNDVGMLCAAGNGKREVLAGLLAGNRSGLIFTDRFSPGRPFAVGRIDAELPEIGDRFGYYRCRNNSLLLAAQEQIRGTVQRMIARFGKDRIGCVLGTSTSGVRNTELALAYQAANGALPPDFHYKQQQMGASADFLAACLNLGGPAYTLSTACSSSGRAIASARRLLRLGLCDAVIVGGADTLCNLTINGFAALESLSGGLCRPFGAHRDGINIGEAACLFVLSREPGPVELLGIGSTSDAYHFSAPDPDGLAVGRAMQLALEDAGKRPEEIDYLNLHGTATVLNDSMESKAVNGLFGVGVPAGSSKGMTGHTLGAAAALELGFCWLLLNSDDEKGRLIPNVNDDTDDPLLTPLNLVRPGSELKRRIDTCQSNSFAFGGNNISIVVGRA
ncbi:beta-ketoacyl-[acyl-carrier-protein] synthase family protein [Candidatus Methylomicrobium oryzae]|uniref:beta-ketoacyl-[acyl-carrier-protein] synthase family protein n=1 Tax=Candidatus Methylomicrobium oryzae TaxID=2802053 RepID=UPI0019221076|nr:beta-ketoacyl-[acyl-carrier-protein] synthase family protein [Methylomicrobium sp. RS1]MBL1264387.1 beta-ketoacyl-[acyl-carrier-protein] synthase family protein [Methylomicrobium sp. RS1]